jgi:hypothetical protein
MCPSQDSVRASGFSFVNFVFRVTLGRLKFTRGSLEVKEKGVHYFPLFTTSRDSIGSNLPEIAPQGQFQLH